MAKDKTAKAAPKSGSKSAPKETEKAGGSSSLLVVGGILVLIAAVAAAFVFKPSSSESDVDDVESSSPSSSSSSSPSSSEKTGSAGASKGTKKGRQVKPEVEGTDPSLRWSPQTLTVVLPCAGEGEFAKKTVESVAKSVPGGIGGGILEDIVVVDDGSSPPLSKQYLTESFLEKYPVKLVRHDKAVGLMGAKSAGAAHAAGDIIVFFDCHVAPQGDWYKQFLANVAENYRRIVVPQITDLDIDTWKERHRGGGMSKCYLTWDADFKWVESRSPYMPVLSGGLLGISRRWWNETGGYDGGMSGWGGENVDQSLRSWLCGGEIISLSKAFVAHMWRKPQDPRTNQNYEVSNLDAIKNKARAVLAWFDGYQEKAAEYPPMKYVGLDETGGGKANLNRDISNFQEVKDRLQCRPFAWFLWRFRDIYVDGGMIPEETFELVEKSSNLCLTYLGQMGTAQSGSAYATLLPCGTVLGHPQGQRWHPRNKKPSTQTCCSAVGSWNTDQCLGQLNNEGMIGTGVCDVAGRNTAPWMYTREPTDGLAAGQLALGSQGNYKCATADKKAAKVPIGRGLEATPLKMVKCKTEGAGKWKLENIKMPLETELYHKALKEQPELFVE